MDLDNSAIESVSFTNITTAHIYALYEMELECPLQFVAKLKFPKTKPSGVVIGSVIVRVISFILQLSTIVLAMLLLLAGDVERNPGPTPDIMALTNELKTVKVKYSEIGIQLGLKLEKIREIELDHSTTDRRFTEVLNFWLEGNTAMVVSWKTIVDALKNMDKAELATHLHKSYCHPTGDTQNKGSAHQSRDLDRTLSSNTEHSRAIFQPSHRFDESQQQSLNLTADIDKMTDKFQDLLDSVSSSLEERCIPISKIVAKIRAFNAFEPVFAYDDSRPILEHRMRDLENCKSVYEVMTIIGAYTSFFNYHLVERIIDTLGTDRDRKQLSDYKKEFKLYAERIVCEVPSTYQSQQDTQAQSLFIVKVDDRFEKCTLSHQKRFIIKLSEVLSLSAGTLLLESITQGCIELTFRVPIFVYQKVFPLSSEQESVLSACGVVKIIAGEYQYPANVNQVSRFRKNSDSDDDKSDDGALPDNIASIVLELMGLTEDVSSKEAVNPYEIDYEHKLVEELKEVKSDASEGVTPLHIASYFGKIEYVKKLIDSERYGPSQKDKHGRSALHYAAYGGHLDLLKYYIEHHNCNSVSFGAHGETALHIACRVGNLEMVMYLLIDQKVDPMCNDESHDIDITPLHAACLGGSIDIVRLLVTHISKSSPIKEIVENKTKLGDTPVHFAAVKGHINIVKFFLSDLNCDPNVQGKQGSIPLHCAAHGGHLQIVKYLVETKGCNPAQLNDMKTTPLMFAAGSKSLETVKYLAQLKSCDPMHRDYRGCTSLHVAALVGHLETVKYFVSELNCNPSALDEHLVTPLHIAAMMGHVQVIEYLIDEGKCNPSVQDDNNQTPVYLATQGGHLDAVKFLTIRYNCELLEGSTGNTAVHAAAFGGHIKVMDFFLTELHHDPNIPTKNIYGAKPLHIAAQVGHLDLLKYLIDQHKCDPLTPDHNGLTPLHFAASNGHLNIVKYLIEDIGCDAMCQNFNGKTPIHFSAKEGQLKITKYFISVLKCNPTCRDKHQRVPLHAAALRGHVQIMDYLIDDGKCDPSVCDEINRTPLHYAGMQGHLDAVKFLTISQKCDPLCKDSYDDTVLHLSCLEGHIKVVKFLILDLRCDPNLPGQKGQLPLHMAAQGGHVNIMKYLINDHKCNPSTPTKDKMLTPLHSAVSSGNLEAVKYLVQDKGCDPMCKTSHGETPFHAAALVGPIEVVKYFISDLKYNPNLHEENSQATLLHFAAQGGHVDIIKYLINEEKCNPSQKTNLGRTPLHDAAVEGQLEVVKFLTLNHYCSVVCEDSHGNTPLHASTFAGHTEVVKFLISELHCDPNTPGDDEAKPVHIAAERGHVDILKYLIEVQKCNPSDPTYRGGKTPLHCSAHGGNLAIVKYLIQDKGCDPNCRDKENSTPLHYAAGEQCNAIVEYLITDLKCDPNLLGKMNKTPLHYATRKGHLSTVKLLLSNINCDPIIRGYLGETPIHSAAAGGHISVVEYLIYNKHCNPSELDMNRLTPLHYAALEGHLQLVKFLTTDKILNPSAFKNQLISPLQMAAGRGHTEVVEYLNNFSQLKWSINTITTFAEHQRDKNRHKSIEYPQITISNHLKEGESLLKNEFTSSLQHLPSEITFTERMVNRHGISWLFVAEITNDEYSQVSGQNHRILVCDRSGKYNIPIVFNPIVGEFNFTSLKRGHTILVLNASKWCFSDMTIGLCIRDLSTVFVVPCGMSNLYTISELYYERKDIKCWSCGKRAAAQTSNASATLKKCTGCKVACYCGKECQVKDWKKCHRNLCSALPHFLKLTKL